MPLIRLLESIVAGLRRLLGGTRKPSPTSAPKLLVCPNSKETRAEQTIGPEGGTLQLGEHRLTVPPGALPDKVSFSAALLADKVLKVQIQANGADGFQFGKPASLTLSYAKCEGTADAQRARIYKIDPATNRVLEDLGGTVSVRLRTVTAPLETLSTYTLGYPI